METQNNMFVNQMIVSFVGTNNNNRCDNIGYLANIRNEGFAFGLKYIGSEDIRNPYPVNSEENHEWKLGFIEGSDAIDFENE